MAWIVAAVVIPDAIAGTAQVRSPDGNVVVTVDLVDRGGLEGCPVYGITYRGRPVLVDSRLGLALADAPGLDHGFRVATTSQTGHDGTWMPVYGERGEVRDHYNELAVELEDVQDPLRRLVLKFRAYDEGAAFCYVIPEQPGNRQVIVSAEQTRFRFAGNPTAWASYSAQGTYHPVPLDALQPDCERPLTLELADDC
jgi:alpha-glucosidase